MICSRYLLRRPVIIHLINPKIRYISKTTFSPNITPSTSASLSNFVSEISTDKSDGSSGGKNQTVITPVSISPAGTILRGLNYVKGHDDPISLQEEEYPSWLWKLLDQNNKDDLDSNKDADLFSKSRKLRRKAAKKQRKLEALRSASGHYEEVKVPLTQQSIDLPSNDEKTLEGATTAYLSRNELRVAMRKERRKHIKEKNYLKSV